MQTQKPHQHLLKCPLISSYFDFFSPTILGGVPAPWGSPSATWPGCSYSVGLCAAMPSTHPHGHGPAGPQGTSGQGPCTCGSDTAGWPHWEAQRKRGRCPSHFSATPQGPGSGWSRPLLLTCLSPTCVSGSFHDLHGAEQECEAKRVKVTAQGHIALYWAIPSSELRAPSEKQNVMGLQKGVRCAQGKLPQKGVPSMDHEG